MAKRFFYVAAGVFLLVAAYQLGVERARAEWSGNGWVVGHRTDTFWNAAGEAYQWSAGWQRSGPPYYLDLPVPASEIKSLDANFIVTTDDEVWNNPGGASYWERLPTLPGGPISVQGQSFGATKAKYR